MDILLKITALCTVASVTAALLKQNEGAISLVLTLCAAIFAAALLVTVAEPLISLGQDLIAMTGLSHAVFTPLLKLLSIALVVRVAAAFCRDASQGALAASLECAGAVCALTVAAPLLRAVVELVEGWL